MGEKGSLSIHPFKLIRFIDKLATVPDCPVKLWHHLKRADVPDDYGLNRLESAAADSDRNRQESSRIVRNRQESSRNRHGIVKESSRIVKNRQESSRIVKNRHGIVKNRQGKKKTKSSDESARNRFDKYRPPVSPGEVTTTLSLFRASKRLYT